MNTTTRRIVTTLAGVGLAATAFASTGPAAVAAKPGGGGTTVQPLDVYSDIVTPYDRPQFIDVFYSVPGKMAKEVSCSLDGVALADCGQHIYLRTYGITNTHQYFTSVDGATAAEHTYSITVVAGKTTYTGSTTFSLAM